MTDRTIAPGELGTLSQLHAGQIVKEWPFGDMCDPGSVGSMSMDTPLAEMQHRRPVRLLGRIVSVDDRYIHLSRVGRRQPSGRRDHEPLVLTGHPEQRGIGQLLCGVDVAASVILTAERDYMATGALLGLLAIEQPCSADTPLGGCQGYVHGMVEQNTIARRSAAHSQHSHLRLRAADGLIRLKAPKAGVKDGRFSYGVGQIAEGTYIRSRVSSVLEADGRRVYGGTGELYVIG